MVSHTNYNERKRERSLLTPAIDDAGGEPGIPLDSPALFINREISWLQFTRRILCEAKADCHPLLERVKFLALFASNLDEFFMIRVSGLRRQQKAGALELPPDGLSPDEQMVKIREMATSLYKESRECWQDRLVPLLELQGIRIKRYSDLREDEREYLRGKFETDIAPVLTPLAFDATHPFPFISNLSLNLAVILKDPKRGRLFSRVKVPVSIFSRLIRISPQRDNGTGKETGYVLLEDLVASNLDLLFPGVPINAAYPFRVTRDADIEIREDEASDLLAAVEEGMEARRLGFPIRLEIDEKAPPEICSIIAGKLDLSPQLVYRLPGPIGFADLMEMTAVSRPDLKYTPFLPSVPLPFLLEKNIFSALRTRDIILYHPYESFLPVISFLQQAAEDPDVLAIKITLYRIDEHSPLIDALIEARQNGKQVTAIVELKARFDEKRNIIWAKALERAGVHIVYGLFGLKVHAKVCMVVRREGERIVRYVHMGTGNYNATTARLYADLSFFTTDPSIGADVSDLFNMLTGYSRIQSFRSLIVAPVSLRRELLNRIKREIKHQEESGNGAITIKVNGLEDREIIQWLYRASMAGVRIRLDVRGICCLRPGIPGTSNTIRVTSLVDRFLEHSRIYHFHNRGEDEVFLGSADLRPRNLDRRVEILFPVKNPGLRDAILDKILAIHLKDNTRAWELLGDGTYRRLHPQEDEEPIRSQTWFLENKGVWQYHDG
ncbi:MAG: polyphosphate kinase 1 [Methanolinea sp.]|nr:polyphosphate kinase 1 [Methanolinea sp.]